MPTRTKILLYGVAYPAFFLFAFVLGAYWTFPYDHLRDYLVQEAERGRTMQLEIASLSPSWLTGVELEGVRFATISEDASAPPNAIALRSVSARASLLALLAGDQSLSFDAEIDGGGSIEGSYASSEELTHVEATLANVSLQRLGPLQQTVGIPIAGRASGTIDLAVAREAANTEGSVELTVENVSVGDGETPLEIEGLGGGLTLERMNLGTLRFRMETERGSGDITQMRADGEHAQLWGDGTLRLVQPLSRSSIDLLLRIKFKDAYREASPRMGVIFQLLEANPAVRPARTPDGALQWRIQGAFAGRVRMVPSGRLPMEGVE